MTVRLLLGDQLNLQHSWFQQVNPKVTYVMFEMRQETDYVKHHIQKIVAFFGAMRSFADALQKQGHSVVYYRIGDSQNTQQLTQNLLQVMDQCDATAFTYLHPDEYRLEKQLQAFCDTLSIATAAFDTEHFLTTRATLKEFYSGKKQFVMEFFYRKMRKQFDILMLAGQPEGGTWNFDKNNRNKWKGADPIPKAYVPKARNITAIYNEVVESGIVTLGTFNADAFLYPTSREQALEQLQYFCEHLLYLFGTYQDAMHTDEENLFHSRISFALNAKIISPLEVVSHAIAHYRENTTTISLSQIEGFVRQIIGWREYIRGMYWMEMPQYKTRNELENTRPLPSFYWDGNTQMNCLKHSIQNSLDHAYAHHIQRLMITGNFALLTQTHPDEVDQWYLGIYADAIEWVQLPNTRGMSQYADGGKVATKPYISSGAYIHKMSNYCASCSYNHKKRLGDDACPFNSLYWNFLDDKRSYLKNNHRMGIMYRLLDKIPAEELAALKERAYQVITHPERF
ncbi:MAG: cryptochrome/photolyase family protein [Flavobacteriaceae bacterium]|nr:cryptochrome/photolyase family protein [Flavobacteriaceae bacterium]